MTDTGGKTVSIKEELEKEDSDHQTGSVVLHATNLLLTLIESGADPEEVKCAANSLERERLLMEECDTGSWILLLNLTESLEIAATWIVENGKRRQDPQTTMDVGTVILKEEEVQTALNTVKIEVEDDPPTLAPIKEEEPDEEDDKSVVRMIIDKNEAMISSLQAMARDQGLELTDQAADSHETYLSHPVKQEEEELEEARPRRSCVVKFSYEELKNDEGRESENSTSDEESDARDEWPEDDESENSEDLTMEDAEEDSAGENNSKSPMMNESLKKNRPKQDATGRWQCGKCDQSFSARSSLLRHEISHLAVDDPRKSELQCELCGKIVSSLYWLKFHKQTHLDDNDPAKCQFKCDKCGKAFRQERSLKYHFETHHAGIIKRSFECTICGETFKSIRPLYYHKKSHLDDEKDEKSRQPHKCEKCQRRFSYPHHLRRHAKIHWPADDPRRKKFKCDACGMFAADSNSLKIHKLQHMEGEENQRPVKCDLCEWRFRTNGQVNAHKRIKHPESLPPKRSRSSIHSKKVREVEENNDKN